MDINSAGGRAAGLTDRQILELADYRTSDAFNDLERDVLEYADAMTATPVDVPDALYARIRAAFTEPALVELTGAIAFENYRARFNRAFLIGSQGYASSGVCALPAHNTTRQ
jgi:alkylhydroperoxidase family enzyme